MRLPPGYGDHFGEIIRQAVKRGGKILIPAFAVERTQQLLYVLHELFERGEIPHLPVYVDSPLAVSATEIYRLHPDAFNRRSMIPYSSVTIRSVLKI